MSPLRIDRREFLQSGFTLASATLVGVSTLGCDSDRLVGPSPPSPPPRRSLAPDGDLADPRVIGSVGGMLVAALTCATSPVRVGGRMALQPVTYDGSFPGPTLWVRPGDVVDLTLVNRIVFDQAETKPGYGRPPHHANTTNLHFHGMHVPFTGEADNMLLMVPARGSQSYRFQVPANHPAGLFWYHGHVHGLVTSQVSRGGAGLIYVANAHTDLVAQLGIRRRLMLLQQAYFEPDLRTLTYDDGEREDPELTLSVINGELMPEIRMRPGEPQVWCLCNGSSSTFYVLRLEGHTFDVVAEDGVPLPAPGRRGQETLMLASGKRLEVVVRASGTPGRYTLSYDEYDQGVDTWPRRSVGTVVVDGPAWDGPDHPGVDGSTPMPDLRAVPVDRERTIVFGMDESVAEGEFGRFTINGHAWDPAYSEWTSTLDTVEEWLIRNDTEQDHPFHVHVNPFQITRVNGAPVAFDGYQDTAIVPRFGSITVRTRFTDFTGGPVLMHCHILDHEDMGMMARFEIAPA